MRAVAVWALLSCLAVLVAARFARAQPVDGTPNSLLVQQGIPLPLPAPPQRRLHLAIGLADPGPNGTMAKWPGGSTEDSQCPGIQLCSLNPILDLGADWSPTRHFGFGVRARWLKGTDFTDWPRVMGRTWDVLEVLLTPQLNLPWPWRWPRGGLRPYLALPIGPAWSFQSRAWSRAVAEEWHSRTGVSVGGALGFEFYLSRRWGFVVETSYQERYLSADVVETPVDEPQAQASERVTLMQRHLAFSVGLLVALDR